MPTPETTVQPSITIRAGDKVIPDGCSRCTGELGTRIFVAVWNQLEFAYCAGCIAAETAPPAKCPTCGQRLPGGAS